VAKAIESVIPCNRIAMAVVGLEVPHVHVHLIPMDTMNDVNFKNPKLKFTPEEYTEIAEKIRKRILFD